MKQSDVRRILNHVLMNFSCPKCESQLHQGEVNINLKTSLGIMFSIDCPECQTKINVNGFLPKQGHYAQEIATPQINIQNIKHAVDKIKNFSGDNLADLFK